MEDGMMPALPTMKVRNEESVTAIHYFGSQCLPPSFHPTGGASSPPSTLHQSNDASKSNETMRLRALVVSSEMEEAAAAANMINRFCRGRERERGRLSLSLTFQPNPFRDCLLLPRSLAPPSPSLPS